MENQKGDGGCTKGDSKKHNKRKEVKEILLFRARPSEGCSNFKILDKKKRRNFRTTWVIRGFARIVRRKKEIHLNPDG